MWGRRHRAIGGCQGGLLSLRFPSLDSNERGAACSRPNNSRNGRSAQSTTEPSCTNKTFSRNQPISDHGARIRSIAPRPAAAARRSHAKQPKFQTAAPPPQTPAANQPWMRRTTFRGDRARYSTSTWFERTPIQALRVPKHATHAETPAPSREYPSPDRARRKSATQATTIHARAHATVASVPPQRAAELAARVGGWVWMFESTARNSKQSRGRRP
jgi:hypothetical protein